MNLTSLDAKLDAVSDAAKVLLPEVEAAFTDARKAGDFAKHARLHRMHRSLHDFVLICAEPRA